MNYLSKIINWFKNNFKPISNDTFKVVVLCVVTATTFWVFNALNDNYSTTISYPLQLDYNSEDIIATQELPENIEINVSAGGWNLLRKTFWFNIPPVTVNPEQPTERKYYLGSALFETVADQITEIELNYVDTDTVWLHFDSIKSKTVVISVDSTSLPIKDGYIRTSPISLSIDSATFTGPKENIQNIPNPYLIKITSDSIDSDYKEDIYLPTFGSSLVSRNPVEATVYFEVQALIDVELERPYKIYNLSADSSNFQFEDSLVGVNFKIKEDIQNKIPLDSIQLSIDMNILARKDSFFIPEIDKLPVDIQQESFTVDSIKYNYKK